jgi:hydroxymethylpyrimidine/phosphomethylpyrimidine kinase
VALTIAGSDSGGGAGIQADLATFAALDLHGASAITAVTVQDTTGVHGIHPVPVEFIIAQVEAVLRDLNPAAVKVGMLGDETATRAVADFARAGRLARLVVDPVLASTSGHSLAASGVTRALLEDLFPHATLITPNTDEAAALLGTRPAASVDEQVDQARSLLRAGPAAVVITGAVAVGPDGVERVDVLAARCSGGVRVLRSPEILTTNDHGTGCTYAAAAAAYLARGESVHDAVRSARSVVRRALHTSAAWRLGRGRGPVAHTAAAFLVHSLTVPSAPDLAPTTQGATR